MSMQQKLKKLGISTMVLAAGFAYYLAARFFFAIPCMFRTLTGFKCPGCGITHMLVAELQFNFAQAYAANPALYLLQPVIGYFIGKMYICWFLDKSAGGAGQRTSCCMWWQQYWWCLELLEMYRRSTDE